MMKLTAAAGLALALVSGSAFAADLPSRKEAPVYVPPPAPVFTWSGLYGGVNIGYGWSAGGNETGGLDYPGNIVGEPIGAAWGGANDINGVLGGGQIGYNYQFSPWLVVGVETDMQAADLNSQRNFYGPGYGVAAFGGHYASVNSAKYVDWFGTVRGRVGVTLPTFPGLLLYGTGGFAYGQVNHTVSAVDVFPAGFLVNGRSNFFDTATGWTAGGGVEWSPAGWPAWSLKVEYLYTDLGSTNQGIYGGLSYPGLPAGVPFVGVHTSPTRFNTVRAGLNWHFNPFAASAPVLAKY